MYYRGANAALLLYDITSAATFDDIKGWLEGAVSLSLLSSEPLFAQLSFVLELKKNCSSELIIYIVGSKADLHHQRQVTSDLARLSLHNWFPPSPPPSPPASPPAPAPSTLSYMRPRFTSFTSIRSAPLNSTPSSPPHSASYLDPAVKDTPVRHCSTGVAISRSKTSLPSKPKAVALHRSHTLTDPPRSHRSRYWSSAFHNDPGESSSNSIAEDDETEDDQQWGVCKGMELFEVSAKDDLGKVSVGAMLASSADLFHIRHPDSVRFAYRSDNRETTYHRARERPEEAWSRVPVVDEHADVGCSGGGGGGGREGTRLCRVELLFVVMVVVVVVVRFAHVHAHTNSPCLHALSLFPMVARRNVHPRSHL